MILQAFSNLTLSIFQSSPVLRYEILFRVHMTLSQLSSLPLAESFDLTPSEFSYPDISQNNTLAPFEIFRHISLWKEKKTIKDTPVIFFVLLILWHTTYCICILQASTTLWVLGNFWRKPGYEKIPGSWQTWSFKLHILYLSLLVSI